MYTHSDFMAESAKRAALRDIEFAKRMQYIDALRAHLRSIPVTRGSQPEYWRVSAFFHASCKAFTTYTDTYLANSERWYNEQTALLTASRTEDIYKMLRGSNE